MEKNGTREYSETIFSLQVCLEWSGVEGFLNISKIITKEEQHTVQKHSVHNTHCLFHLFFSTFLI